MGAKRISAEKREAIKNDIRAGVKCKDTITMLAAAKSC